MDKSKSSSSSVCSKPTASKSSAADLKCCIEKKARELWEKKGRVQGKDLEIWLEAEKMVKCGKA